MTDTNKATLFFRRNGRFGASYRGVRDTGHFIVEDSGRFTVYSIHDDDRVIAASVTRDAAEAAIARDWDAEFVR